MKLSGHLVSSAVGATIVYCLFRSVLSAVVFFLSSILIDIDHFFEYVRERGIKNFSFRVFCQWCYDFQVERVWIVFHSFELLIVLWALIVALKLNIYWISAALGITFHYVLDCLFNPVLVGTYFFIFRWRKQFYVEKIFRKENVEKSRCQS